MTLRNFGTLQHDEIVLLWHIFKHGKSLLFSFLFLFFLFFYFFILTAVNITHKLWRSFVKTNFGLVASYIYFAKHGDSRNISTNSVNFFKRFSDGFFRNAKVMEGCCSIKWKNVLFHHISRSFIKRWRILFDFPLAAAVSWFLCPLSYCFD